MGEISDLNKVMFEITSIKSVTKYPNLKYVYIVSLDCIFVYIDDYFPLLFVFLLFWINNPYMQTRRKSCHIKWSKKKNTVVQ